MLKKTKTKRRKSTDLAVIDIGSNSVRLVIFRCWNKKAHVPVFEKKATCGLARGMLHKKPKLHREGSAISIKVLRKFGRILQKRKPDKIIAIGTAAMRAVAGTKAGRKFHRRAERALGARIKIISGVKEARLTAFGVLSSVPRAKGVCGDLGGGSLELASVNKGRVGHTITVALGSLTLISESRNDPLKAEKLMLARLNNVKWLGKMKGGTFYPIGGSWRAVGRVMMKNLGRTVRSVHCFTINADKARLFAEDMAREKVAKFRKMHRKIRPRADVIPYAAAAMAEIIIRMRPARITFSGHGVREGLVREYQRR